MLVDFIQVLTGKKLSRAFICMLEQGTVEPKFNTLAITLITGWQYDFHMLWQ